MVKDNLEQLVADPEWKAWAGQAKYKAAANEARKLVYDDKFWKVAEDLHIISE